jgi:hypothetical protein
MFTTKGTRMRGPSIPFARFTLSLALILALGDVHCALTEGASHAAAGPTATAPMKPGHECCKGGAASGPEAPARPEAPPCCGCTAIPSWTLPTDSAPLAAAPVATGLAVLASFDVLPAPVAAWTPLPPATGSPPGLVALRAHGLRAPPTTV